MSRIEVLVSPGHDQRAQAGVMTESPALPKARKDLVLQEVGSEAFLYDKEGELVHILNVTALEIWRACDGRRDVPGLEARIRERFADVEGHDLKADIGQLLEEFRKRGLLE
jgi:hypothetical protein